MQYFTKVTTDVYNEFFIWANKKPLRWAILMNISARVSSKDQVTRNIKKGEFFLSNMEYKKFGLSKSKKNNISNVLNDLIEFKIIEKVGNRRGYKNSVIYRFINTNFIDCSREYKKVGNKMETEWKQNGNEMVQTKNDKIIKNDQNIKKKDTPKKTLSLDLKNYLFQKIKEFDFDYAKDELLKFFEYRMAKVKKEQFKSQSGIDGLFRAVIGCRDSHLDVKKCLVIAIESETWKLPVPKYYKNYPEVNLAQVIEKKTRRYPLSRDEKNQAAVDSFVERMTNGK